MKKIILVIFTLFLFKMFGQTSESQVDITMSLEPVVEVYQLSGSEIRVTNTDNIIINYCDKYFRVSPGIHLILVDIHQNCRLMTIVDDNRMDLERRSNSFRTIINGIRTIDYYSNQIIRVDSYIEYTICDSYFDNN